MLNQLLVHLKMEKYFFLLEFDRLSIVLRPAQEYFTYMETSPLPVKGCKI
jgi:hypothetical protein